MVHLRPQGSGDWLEDGGEVETGHVICAGDVVPADLVCAAAADAGTAAATVDTIVDVAVQAVV